MRIAVLADTHNRLPRYLPEQIAKADEIWHLGDVTDESTLDPIRDLGLPFYVVRGNGDWNVSWPWVRELEREGFRIRLVHIPPLMAPPAIDIVVHGHTHIPRNEKIGDVRFYNPGSVGKPNHAHPSSYAWLELNQGLIPKWEVVKL